MTRDDGRPQVVPPVVAGDPLGETGESGESGEAGERVDLDGVAHLPDDHVAGEEHSDVRRHVEGCAGMAQM
jgi:hypothetical protein